MGNIPSDKGLTEILDKLIKSKSKLSQSKSEVELKCPNCSKQFSKSKPTGKLMWEAGGFTVREGWKVFHLCSHKCQAEFRKRFSKPLRVWND